MVPRPADVFARTPAANPYSSRTRGIHYITDPEGRRNAIVDLVNVGKLDVRDGQLQFVSAHDSLICGGDFGDRDVYSLDIAESMLDFRGREGERVAWCSGNRDIKGFGLLRLREFGQRGVDIAERLDTWLTHHSAPGSLEFHRAALSRIAGGNVDLEEAARDFIARQMPGGTWFRLAEEAQPLIARGSVLFSHGGINEFNMGVIPGSHEPVANPRDWVVELNRWYHDRINDVRDRVLNGGFGEHVPNELINYGDAVWDPVAKKNGRAGVVFGNSMSVSYPIKMRGNDNPRAPKEEVEEYLAVGGFDTTFSGHWPIFGDTAGFLRAKRGLLVGNGDTSYSEKGSSGTVTIMASGRIVSRSVSSIGNTISANIRSGVPSPVGLITQDGTPIVGRTRVDGQTYYVLRRRGPGRQVTEELVLPADLKARNPQHASVLNNDDAEEAYRSLVETLTTTLADDGTSRFTVHEASDLADAIGNKEVCVLMGASKFGELPTTRARLLLQLEALAETLDPQKHIVLTGGTEPDESFEKMVHDVFLRRGFRIIGLLNEGTGPEHIKSVREHAIVGTFKNWAQCIEVGAQMVAKKGGFAAFVGGGKHITAGIATAESLGIPYFLLRKHDDAKGDGGASAIAALRYPGRAIDRLSEISTRL